MSAHIRMAARRRVPWRRLAIGIAQSATSSSPARCRQARPVWSRPYGCWDGQTVTTNDITSTESGPGSAATAHLDVNDDGSVGAPPPGADLSVTVSAPSRVMVGQAYPYRVTVTNAGPTAASTVVATLAVSGPDRDVTTRHRFATIAAGHSASFTVTEVDPLSGTATATVTSATADPDPANDRARVTTRVALF